MQFSDARLFSSDGSGHLNELNLNNSVSSLTRRVNQLKTCSCVRSWTSESSLVIFSSKSRKESLGPDYMTNFSPVNRAEILLRLHDELQPGLKY